MVEAKNNSARRFLVFIVTGCVIALVIGFFAWRLSLQSTTTTEAHAGPQANATTSPTRITQEANIVSRSTQSTRVSTSSAQSSSSLVAKTTEPTKKKAYRRSPEQKNTSPTGFVGNEENEQDKLESDASIDDQQVEDRDTDSVYSEDEERIKRPITSIEQRYPQTTDQLLSDLQKLLPHTPALPTPGKETGEVIESLVNKLPTIQEAPLLPPEAYQKTYQPQTPTPDLDTPDSTDAIEIPTALEPISSITTEEPSQEPESESEADLISKPDEEELDLIAPLATESVNQNTAKVTEADSVTPTAQAIADRQ
ncbi:hypothetical protein [Corynebacterium sp. sy039]|uniref:hypothetical protein n=1 Tax=Corynebacterium sp. sy039 TaxID=2599641 RepID=UPI0011B56984|nr:hypothetical protein [Corynebacterium sp. sy039]QDZ42124.1 hypothetical protein FQV43_02260 [Corynebacterium sp. sy039]